MNYHYTKRGYGAPSWGMIKESYSKIMNQDVKINYVTLVRSHREHYLSCYYFSRNLIIR